MAIRDRRDGYAWSFARTLGRPRFKPSHEQVCRRLAVVIFAERSGVAQRV